MTWLRVVYQHTSFPDIVVVVGHDERAINTRVCPAENNQQHTLVRSNIQDWNLIAVAHGVTMTQCSNLLAHLHDGWQAWSVQVLPLVFNSIGTVRIETEHHLHTIGVNRRAASACCIQLIHATDSIQCKYSTCTNNPASSPHSKLLRVGDLVFSLPISSLGYAQ